MKKTILRSVKGVLKPLALAVLSVDAIAILLRRPMVLLVVLFDKLGNAARRVHDNLPQVARLAKSRQATKNQVAAKYYTELEELVQGMPYCPKFSVIVPVYKVQLAFFKEMLLSVTHQVYDNWELCIVDDCSGDPAITALIAEFAAAHPNKIKSATNPTNVHISATSNECLKLASGDYVALLDHDDRLYPNALAEMVRFINLHNQPDILYSDECTIDDRGDRLKPVYHKPGWSPLMHLTMNYTTHLTVYRRSLVNDVGGFRVGFEGSQDHDLMLRMVEKTTKPVVHVPFCLYQWRAHAESTAGSAAAKPYAAIAGERAVTEHLARLGRPAVVTFDGKQLLYRVRFALPTPLPLISIVIPSRDSPALIMRCINSLLERSTYPNFEIIVADNGTTDEATIQYYKELETRLPSRFHVRTKKRPFNFGAQVNDGVRDANGEYIVLLNNDTEVLEPAWMEEMLGLAQLPETGAVGAKLLFGSKLIQHAGVVLSAARIAEHLGFLRSEHDAHYWNYINTMHEVMAVTAACMMIHKDKYWEVNGLDEVYLPRAYGDVEFCLALRDRGYTNVYTPHATLYHHESASRGKAIEYFERQYLLTRRGKELAADPYLNLNFIRSSQHHLDAFYTDLDYDRREFAMFIDNPKANWRQAADEMGP